MYIQPAHFKDQPRRRLITALRPALFCISLLTLPGIASAEDEHNSAAAAEATDEPGVVFRIQDYIPGTFETRLQYVSLNGGTSGEWNLPISLGRSGSFIPHSAYYYLSRGMYDDLFRTNTTSTGSFHQSTHYESPRKTVDSQFYITGSYAPRKIRYLDNKVELDYRGYGQSREGTEVQSYLNADVSYSTNRWYYTENSWALQLNPYLRLRKNQSIRRDDWEVIYERYDVVDTLTLDYSHKTKYDRENENVSFISNANLYLAVGRGRVYDGTSTWRAIDLLETVAEISGIPATDIGREDYEQLALVLYDLNRRKYPSQEFNRLRDYERTEHVVEVLKRELGVENLPPRAIAAVHDILKYYPTFARSFGQRWYFQVGGEYRRTGSEDSRISRDTHYENSDEHFSWIRKDTNEYLTTGQTLRVSAGLVYESYRPLSTKWQWNLQGAARLYQYHEAWEGTREDSYWSHHWGSDTSESHSEQGDTVSWWNPRTYASLRVDAECYYIKDSRTWWEFSTWAVLNGSQYFPDTNLVADDPRRQKISSWSGRLAGEVTYHRYLAWKLYLTASVSCRIDYGDVIHSRTDWADLRRGAGWYSANISLAYYL